MDHYKTKDASLSPKSPTGGQQQSSGQGFSGRREDSLGRQRCYQDGKLVACAGNEHEPEEDKKDDEPKDDNKGQADFSDPKFAKEWEEAVGKHIDEIEQQGRASRHGYSAQEVAAEQDWHGQYIQHRLGNGLDALPPEEAPHAARMMAGLLNPKIGGKEYIAGLLEKLAPAAGELVGKVLGVLAKIAVTLEITDQETIAAVADLGARLLGYQAPAIAASLAGEVGKADEGKPQAKQGESEKASDLPKPDEKTKQTLRETRKLQKISGNKLEDKLKEVRGQESQHGWDESKMTAQQLAVWDAAFANPGTTNDVTEPPGHAQRERHKLADIRRRVEVQRARAKAKQAGRDRESPEKRAEREAAEEEKLKQRRAKQEERSRRFWEAERKKEERERKKRNGKSLSCTLPPSRLQWLMKGVGEPCKPGETSARTGCVTAEGESHKQEGEPDERETEAEQDSEEEGKERQGTPDSPGDSGKPGVEPGRGGDTGQRGDAGRPDGGSPGGAGGKARILVARADLTRSADPGLVPEHLREHLNDAQMQGAASAIRAMGEEGGYLLADGTGVGKTRQVLAVAAKYAAEGKKVLIVSPKKAIKADWKKGSFSGSYLDDSQTMGIGNLKLNKGDAPLAAGEIALTTYQGLSKIKGQVDNNTVVIYEEAHELKNWSSAKTKHASDMSKAAHSVLYSTATPADKPLHIGYLFRTGIFGSGKWSDTYERLGMHKVEKRIGGGQTIETWEVDQQVGKAEMLRRMSGLFDRMTKDGMMIKREISLDGVDVQAEHVQLPPEAKQEMDEIDRRLSGDDHYEKAARIKEQIYALKDQYRGMSEDARGMREGNAGYRTEDLPATQEQMKGLRAKIDELHGNLSAIYANAKTSNRGVVLLTQRMAQERHKVDHAVDSIKREVAEGRQVVLFGASVNATKRTDAAEEADTEDADEADTADEGMNEGTLKRLAERLKQEGIAFGELHGGVSEAAQRKAMDKFQSGEHKVVIGTVQSGGTGINLDDRTGKNPRTLFMMTPPFSGVENVQAAGRINRLTTKSASRIRYLLADTPIDRWNASLIAGKMKTLGATVSGQVAQLDIPEEPGADPHREMEELIEKKGAYQWPALRGPEAAASMSFPFGKHQGKKLSEVPNDYLQWAHDNMDALRPDQRKLIKQHLASTPKSSVLPPSDIAKAKEPAKTVKLSGNTYEHRESIKASGGRWNANEKVWEIPSDKLHKVRELSGVRVEGEPAPKAEPRYAISGNTFAHKDDIRAAGGRWDSTRKVWSVPASAKPKLERLRGLQFDEEKSLRHMARKSFTSEPEKEGDIVTSILRSLLRKQEGKGFPRVYIYELVDEFKRLLGKLSSYGIRVPNLTDEQIRRTLEDAIEQAERREGGKVKSIGGEVYFIDGRQTLMGIVEEITGQRAVVRVTSWDRKGKYKEGDKVSVMVSELQGSKSKAREGEKAMSWIDSGRGGVLVRPPATGSAVGRLRRGRRLMAALPSSRIRFKHLAKDVGTSTPMKSRLGIYSTKGESYFETCPRDGSGHCKPKDEGDETAEGPEQQASVGLKPSKIRKAGEKPKAQRGDMSEARREGKGKDAKVILADGKAAPKHITPSMIPPQWTNVKVNLDPKSDLLVTAKDAKGRAKAVYSDKFHMRTAAWKFAKTEEGLRKFQQISNQNQDNRKNASTKENADCTWLLQEQGTRPGGETDTKGYADLYKSDFEVAGEVSTDAKGKKKSTVKMVFKTPEGQRVVPIRDIAAAEQLQSRAGGNLEDARYWLQSFGATTLEARHVVKAADGVRLQFMGKESVWHDHLIRDPEMGKMLLERKKTAQQRGGKLFDTNAESLRKYVGTLNGGKFRPKDMRTMLANRLAIAEINRNKGCCKDDKHYKQAVKSVAEKVSHVLGNDPAMALKAYIDPAIFTQWKVAS